MTKYIIKNCPCYWNIGEDDGCSLENMKPCEDDNDCILKKIVDLCKEEIIFNDRWSESRAFAKEILSMLEIEECE